MPSPLQTSGAQLEKPPKYAPIATNRFWTGLWTNRSPLRDAATPYLYEKFYSGSRFESLLGGVNVELGPRLTVTRRPGNSVYNSQTFPAIDTFYPFHIFNNATNTEAIRVIADTAATVYDATGPSTQTSLFTKAGTAGQTSFQSVGDTLYAGDGTSLWKWLWEQNWQPSTGFAVGTVVTDSNQNLQQLVGSANTVISNVAIANNLLTLSVSSAALVVGSTYLLGGLTTATFLNGIYITLLSASSSILTATVPFTTYTSAADSGSVYLTSPFAAAVTSASTPSWGTSPGSVTQDSTALWLNKGPMVQNWGTAAPTVLPTVANVPNTAAFSAWVAATFYNPSLLVYDGTNIQLLTTAGTTGTGVPTWLTSGTTTDGSAVWTFQGAANRVANHSYAVGATIRVAVTQTIQVPVENGNNGAGRKPVITYTTKVITTGTYFYKCTTAGSSNSSVTGNIQWPSGLGATVSEPTESLVWTNIGPAITRATANASNVIGNSTLVSLATQISDSNGNLEVVTTAGKTGATAPTWPTAQGTTVIDGFAAWLESGPATSGNAEAWIYGYAFKNSLTNNVSSMSPASAPITLANSSFISVSGAGDPNFLKNGTDTIEIFRTTQGQSTPFFLADIPAPLNGQPWSYIDASPDPPNPASTLNEFIEADTSGINTPPVAGMTGLSYYLSRVWGINGEFVFYSAAPDQSIGVGTEQFPGENFFQMPSSVITLWPSTQGMMFFTIEGVYVSVGIDGNGNPNQPQLFVQDISLLSTNCFTVNGSTPLLLTSDHQLISFDPSSGVTRVGFPIEDKLQGFDPSLSYVAWHTHGPDQALYVADGSTGWYRCNLTPAPESSGYTWSPLAQIVGGVQAVQSVETVPGTKTLLLGPVSSGPILQRDLTVSQDNGASYAANMIVGNIVLAQSGQSSEVAFITTEASRVGSRPSIAVLVDEVSGTFETMPGRVADPPYLPERLTLWSDRWYFSELPNTPAWLKSLQIEFSWPEEDAANELLTYTIYGCLHTEL